MKNTLAGLAVLSLLTFVIPTLNQEVGALAYETSLASAHIAMETNTPTPTSTGEATPSPYRQNTLSLSASLIDAKSDKAGIWDVFTSGRNASGSNKYDRHFRASLYSPEEKTIEYMALKHNTGGEGWSTSLETTTLGKNLYPLVVYIDERRQNSRYEHEIDIPSGATALDLYAQMESESFMGGVLLIYFTDGTAISATIKSGNTRPPTASPTPTGEKLDLALTNVSFDPDPIRVGDMIDTTLTVKNVCGADLREPFTANVQGTVVKGPALKAGRETKVTVDSAFSFTTSGTYSLNFVIDARGDVNAANNVKEAKITVLPPGDQPFIAVVSPNGGETYENDAKIDILYSGVDLSDELHAYVYSPVLGHVAKKIEKNLSGDYGTGKGVITIDLVKDRIVNVIPDGDYKITLCDEKRANPDAPFKPLCDTSDEIFTIKGKDAPFETSITIAHPRGGEIIDKNESLDIKWSQNYNYPGRAVILGIYGLAGKVYAATSSGPFSTSSPSTFTVNEGELANVPNGNYQLEICDLGIQDPRQEPWKPLCRYSLPFTLTSDDAPPPPPCGYNFAQDLTIGSVGADVVALQTYLEAEGFLVLPPDVAKGYFGSLTKDALARFQLSISINPDGYFGEETRAWLNSRTCEERGIIVEALSTSAEVEELPGIGEAGEFQITFAITAEDEDYYVYKGAHTAPSQTAGVIYNVYKNGAIVDISNFQISDTLSAEGTGGADTNDYFLIEEGGTRTFVLDVFLDPSQSAIYAVGVEAIRYDRSEDDGSGDDSTYAIPADKADEFKTDSIHIDA